MFDSDGGKPPTRVVPENPSNSLGDFSTSSILAPLFEPWEEPNAHRVRAMQKGEATVKTGRRRSQITIVQNLRDEVRTWRESGYPGASDTTIQLFDYWFERPHRKTTPEGEEYEFRYYFLQREAIETFVYLKEVRCIQSLSQLIGEYGGFDRQIMALGVQDEEDAWARYAFKLATGTGKTKCMSLAIAWSYFHALRESESPMARHFVVIAPNLTVYERLKLDFVDDDVFFADPVIPPEWRGDWNMSVVLQSSASGSATGGVIYLTNIHRLYDPNKRNGKKEAETYDWLGPQVSKAKALDTGQILRERITRHRRIMVLNDEAHHVWDPDNAWNDAIRFLNDTLQNQFGERLVAQLDFTATPKDNKGQLFKHIICDSPLGEAVDAGIVKTPIIGVSSKELHEAPDENAAYKFDQHLRIGYERWKKSFNEWKPSGKKALLFIMCDSTEAADQITNRLNTDPVFIEVNDRTINLHTNLKGKIKKIRGTKDQYKFVPSEKEISDEDLEALRKLSRELDSNQSPYLCIVSVLMLREGWDVKNVTTIIPLRAYSSKANILPEQTLGRGLRRMTPPGSNGALELVTVVEHSAFTSLYKEELSQEGLPLNETDVDKIPATTVTVFPDPENKDINNLEIQVPRLSGGHTIKPVLEEIPFNEVKTELAKYGSLSLAEEIEREIEYEGRHLFTGEVIERMKIELELLQTGVGAIAYYKKQLEAICKVQNTHQILAPLLEKFFEELLFGERTSLFDERLVVRLGDNDVAEFVRAVFVPLIRKRTTIKQERIAQALPVHLSSWKPYQVTHGEHKKALPANKTLFNLVPCNRELEIAMNRFLDQANDVVAFAKNEGPQSLRIDYLASGHRLSFYTPDFFARTNDGKYYLIETKGRVDRDVPTKARAAISWCKSASSEAIVWEYVFVPEAVFERYSANSLGELVQSCRPSLKNLIDSEDAQEKFPLLAPVIASEETDRPDLEGIVEYKLIENMPKRYRRSVEHSAMLYKFMENKGDMNFAPALNTLLGPLDDAARRVIKNLLDPELPDNDHDKGNWFWVSDAGLSKHDFDGYKYMATNLKKTLLYNGGVSPIGLLRICLDHALNSTDYMDGVFTAIRKKFKFDGADSLLTQLDDVNQFRNEFVAHPEQELANAQMAKTNLKLWILVLRRLDLIANMA